MEEFGDDDLEGEIQKCKELVERRVACRKHLRHTQHQQQQQQPCSAAASRHRRFEAPNRQLVDFQTFRSRKARSAPPGPCW